VAELVIHNVTPWRWSSSRPLWFVREAVVIPMTLRVALASACAVAVGILAWRLPAAARGTAGRRPWTTAALVALLGVAANAAYASLTLADFYGRTHLFSRVWTALLLAAGLSWLASRGSAWRVVAATVAGAWIFLGMLGGLERQDYFAGHWRRHRAELASLLEAAPGLAPDARVVLRMPEHAGLAATAAGYLARGWMVLLHEDPTLECRVVLWADGRPNQCVPATGGLICRGERSPDCTRREGQNEDIVPLDRLVWLDYDPQRRRFDLRATLPAGLDPARLYAPARQIIDRPTPALTRALLDRPRGSLPR
jgi:hypothetical protein